MPAVSELTLILAAKLKGCRVTAGVVVKGKGVSRKTEAFIGGELVVIWAEGC